MFTEGIPISQIDSESFRKLLARNVWFPLIVSLVISTIFGGLIVFQLSLEKKVQEADMTLYTARRIENIVFNAETGMRGFLIAGKESFLEPYHNSLKFFDRVLTDLRGHVRGNPVQLRRLDQIEMKFNLWKNFAEEMIGDRRAGKSFQIEVSSGRGKELIDAIRVETSEFIAEENLAKVKFTEESRETTYFILVAVFLIGGTFGTLLAVMGRRQLMNLSTAYAAALDVQMQQNEILIKDQKLKSNLGLLAETMVGEQNIGDLCDSILATLSKSLGFSVGALYVADEDRVLNLRGKYALETDASIGFRERLQLGEGLVGQAAKENRVLELRDVADSYLRISSSIGEMRPRHVIVWPVETDGRIQGVLELGFDRINSEEVRHFMSVAGESISQAVKSAKYKELLEKLLKEVRDQAKTLQAQQEELRVSNEELEEQTRLQRESQVRLEAQHAELEQSNSQLEAQSRLLEIQKEDLNIKNSELERTRDELEDKAKELQQSSRYKSEFLANMSHELRTPLNSSLILAKLLAENKEGNLTTKQVEFSQQILSSGNDLLMLINDILDLSKVESGKLEIHPEEFEVKDMLDSLEKMFRPIARSKNLGFSIDVLKGTPVRMTSDQMRAEQILKNLLSNAFKFTPEGNVVLTVGPQEDGLSFAVKDSGIGIKESQQKVIFEAFRQADGTTNRKFGGTGLGLSISRDLAKLLHGDLSLKSEEGKGSTFTLKLPLELRLDESQKQTTQAPAPLFVPTKRTTAQTQIENRDQEQASAEHAPFVPDDRATITETDRSILVIEDDRTFALLLQDLVREKGFKCLVTERAQEGVELAIKHTPDAVLLDIGLPDHSGLIVLDQLKDNSKTRHIPIHVVSGGDRSDLVLQMGAVGFLMKPVERDRLMNVLHDLEERIKKDFRDVLVVEDDEVQRNAIRELIEEDGVRITSAGSGKEALELLRKNTFDCVIMDLNLPDFSGFELVDKLAASDDVSYPPIIVYTGRDLTRDEEMRLKRHSQSVIIKGAKSPERLLNEVTLFLHQVESRLSPKRKKMLAELRHREMAFEGKRVLIVDDDVRNIFALTSALEQKGADIVMARNGKEALEQLETQARPIDIVLMDIMMPVMDGFEATTRIRQNPKFKDLPVLALTAKAMADDREKCLKAGASDYLTKPVDLDKLLSLMRVWLSHSKGFNLETDGQL